MEQPNQQLQDYLTTMNRPIPGQSLTEDPDESTPYTSPPEFTVPQEALDYIFETITEEEAYADIMSSIAQGTSIMEVTQLILFAGFIRWFFPTKGESGQNIHPYITEKCIILYTITKKSCA